MIAKEVAGLYGGDGDDYLWGNYNKEADGDAATGTWESHLNQGPNRLDGGAGNDRIDFDTQDWVTGGAGADTFTGYVSYSPDEVARLTDFNPAEDNLTIWVEDGASDVTVNVEDGITPVMQGHVELLSISGEFNLTVGYQLDGANGDVVDAGGNAINASDVNIIIGNHQAA